MAESGSRQLNWKRLVFLVVSLACSTVVALAIGVYFVGSEMHSKYTLYSTKPLPCLFLAPLVLFHTGLKDVLGVGVAISLAFSLMGDTLLLWSNHTFFLAGMGSFLFAHISFIIAFSYGVPLTRRLMFVPVVISLAAATLVAAYFLLRPGVLMFALPVYLGFELCAVWRAAARIGTPDVPTAAPLPWTPTVKFGQWCMFFGTLLFTTSDIILGINKFAASIPKETWFVMTTYWGGQVLIAYGATRRQNQLDRDVLFSDDVDGPERSLLSDAP